MAKKKGKKRGSKKVPGKKMSSGMAASRKTLASMASRKSIKTGAVGLGSLDKRVDRLEKGVKAIAKVVESHETALDQQTRFIDQLGTSVRKELGSGKAGNPWVTPGTKQLGAGKKKSKKKGKKSAPKKSKKSKSKKGKGKGKKSKKSKKSSKGKKAKRVGKKRGSKKSAAKKRAAKKK